MKMFFIQEIRYFSSIPDFIRNHRKHSAEGIAKVAYKDTEHYRMTKQFLDDPERMMKYLLDF